MISTGRINPPMLERMIRLNLITDNEDVYIERFRELVKNMVISQTNIHVSGTGEFVCYEPNGENLHDWAFYLNESDNVICINDLFWIKYHSIFDRINLEEIYTYFRILILAHFNLENFFDEPTIHISMYDKKIADTKI